jgi:hypothetical protein
MMAVIRLAFATPDEAEVEGMNDMAKFFKHQLFFDGISDPLSYKVLEARKDTFAQSLELTQELEAIQMNHRCSQKIAAVKAKLQLDKADTIIWEHLTKDEIEQVAPLWAHNNCYPPKKNSNRLARNHGLTQNNGIRNPNIVCHYCSKKGHLQKDGYSCLCDRGPMVDANCKRYENSHVNNMADK